MKLSDKPLWIHSPRHFYHGFLSVRGRFIGSAEGFDLCLSKLGEARDEIILGFNSNMGYWRVCSNPQYNILTAGTAPSEDLAAWCLAYLNMMS